MTSLPSAPTPQIPQPKTSKKPRWNQAFKRLWLLHWVMFFGFIVIYISGVALSHLPREIAIKGMMFNVHKVVGLWAIALLILRILTVLQVFSLKYLKRHPKFTSAWLKTFLLHTFLYIFMAIASVTGVLLLGRGGHSLPFPFDYLPTEFSHHPSVIAASHSLHSWFSYIMLALVGLHSIAQKNFLNRTWKRIKVRLS